jgi:hypothetical protein
MMCRIPHKILVFPFAKSDSVRSQLLMPCYDHELTRELGLSGSIAKATVSTSAMIALALLTKLTLLTSFTIICCYLMGFITSVTTGLAGSGLPLKAATINLAESAWYVVPALL